MNQQNDLWQLNDRHQAMPSADAVILAYTVDADRGSPDSAYAAQCSSTYVRGEAGWQLAVHHQTQTH